MDHQQVCDDILYNILTRLPVLSIIRFIIVCKQWRDIVTDSNFWENHRLPNSDPNILFTSSQNKTMKLSINTPGCRELLSEVDVANYYFGGTSKGLVLLAPIQSSNSPIIIVNPITRRHVTFNLARKFQNIGGFGISRLSNQYKILFINKYFDSSSIMVQTLGSAAPPRVVMEDLNCNICESLHLNGTIYTRLVESLESLLAFDVEKETCKFIEFPFVHSCSNLMEIGGSLCVASIEKDDIFLWLLDDNRWKISYVLKSSAKNEGVLGVWEFKNTLFVWFLNKKFLIYDRISGLEIIDEGENTDLAEKFVDTSKFLDGKWKLCWGYEPTLDFPKRMEDLEAGCHSSSLYEQRQIKEQENLCWL